MSVFFRSKPEQRTITQVPWNVGIDNPPSPDTFDGALSLVAVYAAVSRIASAVAASPLQAYRRKADGTRERLELPKVLSDPTIYGTRVEWVQRAMTSLLIRGNAYGRIFEIDPTTGFPRRIEWLNPERMTVNGDEYRYDGKTVELSSLLHIPALVVPGKREGVSPLKAASMMVESGLSAQRMTRDWFNGRAIPGSKLKEVNQELSPDQAYEIQTRLTATLATGKPFVHGNNWELETLSLPAEDAGFLSALKFSATQVASLFSIPPEKIGGEAANSLTYATLEMNQLQFVTDALLPWFEKLEEHFSTALMPRPQYVKFNADALLRVDTKTRYETHQIAANIGLNSIDELRELEDLPPLPNGQGKTFGPKVTLNPNGAAPAPVGSSR